MTIECPRCGLGTEDLKPDKQPLLMKKFGDSAVYCCQICAHIFLTKPSGEIAGCGGGW